MTGHNNATHCVGCCAGQCGTDPAVTRTVETPRSVDFFLNQRLIDVAAGGKHSAVVSAAGTTFCWGHGRAGRLACDGEPDCQWQPVPVLGELQNRHIKSVAAGSAHTLVLTVDGDVYAW